MSEVLKLHIPKPEDDGSIQKPTKDVPTGRADELPDSSLVKSSTSPKDVQLALDQLDQAESHV